MLINKNNRPIKKINKDGIIYALIFILYTAVAGLIFVYAINFLKTAINTALSTPNNTEIENRYGQLDLNNYSLVANKLGLKKNSQLSTTNEITAESVATSTIELAPEIIATTTPEVISTMNTSTETASAVKAEEKRPTIIVTNSTLKSGLAASLKNKLTAAGFTVLNTGNSRPALGITTIKVKESVSPESVYLNEIKKIVDSDYDSVVIDLNDNAKSDIEIIIGNR